MTKIIPIEIQKTQIDLTTDQSNTKDWFMVKTMAEMSRGKPSKNVTELIITPATRKTKLALILLPEWGVYFPPYSVSRLSAVARASGYAVDVYDINIEAWHRVKETSDIDFWDSSREFLWEQPGTYFDQIHPHCEPVFNEYIEKIVSSNPDVIGFTMYYTNEACSNWMAEILKRRLPNAKIIVGGPQTGGLKVGSAAYYDHIVQGEGERLLLEILDKVESGTPITDKFMIQPKTERLDLDSLPFPDYSDYDFTKYTIPGGTSGEISRGCVAKCVFCTEVHFWKYRDRQAKSIVDEVEHQHNKYNVNFFWFIDSLVNGNLKELQAFALGVVERKLKIQWQGYARCDSRMDRSYFIDLAASGCHMLNYGIESGSNSVLNDMKKNTTRETIEQNLKDGGAAGIQNSTNWIIGFPSETAQDFADTITIAYRIRNYNLINISPGITMMLSPGSEVLVTKENFQIHSNYFDQAWTTNDLTNTKIHRLIRQKSFQMFIGNMQPNDIIWGTSRPTLDKMYQLNCNVDRAAESIPYEEFDYKINKPNISLFADSLINEIWPLLRSFWRVYGEYDIEIRYIPEEDLKEWGFRLAADYTATYKFSITSEGHWSADFDIEYVHGNDWPTGLKVWPDHSFTYVWQGVGQW